jgi:hypothetical protein
MKIELRDEDLQGFMPFAIFVFKPPDQVMIHTATPAVDGKPLIPDVLAKQLLKDLLSEKCQVYLFNPTQKGN